MADALLSMEEDLTCVICCDVYTDPVTLKCSHSLCEKCLKEFWRTQEVTRCPVCRKECSHDEPTKSLAFKSLCETFKRKKPTPVSEDICQEHNKKLKFFCYEDEKLFCVVCQALKIHENHKWSPVEEAVVNIKAREFDLNVFIFYINIALCGLGPLKCIFSPWLINTTTMLAMFLYYCFLL